MKVIVITGTPGTGKTTIAKKLVKQAGFLYMDINDLIKKNKLEESYDEKRKSKIVDVDKLNSVILKKIGNLRKNKKNKGIIIDSHLSHFLPRKEVSLCIVTKCELKELKKRLEKREYDKDKIRENIESEIFDICLNEAREAGHEIFVIYTNGKLNIKNIAEFIMR